MRIGMEANQFSNKNLVPPGAIPCWYADETEIADALNMNRRFQPYYTASEYFKIVNRRGDCIEGYMGRFDDETEYFTNLNRPLTYFIDYQNRKEVHFTFDRTSLYKVISIMGEPMLFTLQLINPTTMSAENKEMQKGGVTIHAGNGNVITTGAGNVINVNFSYLKGDITKLQNELVKCQVPAVDIAEIKTIVQHEAPGPDGKLPVRTNGWLAKMYSKLLDGSWEVATHVAGGMLVEVLKGYFGLH
jgi:hypothetical protein